MKLQITFLIGLLSSCTILTQKQGPSSCLTLAPRCDATDLVVCETGVEARIANSCGPAAVISGIDLSGGQFGGEDFSNAEMTDTIFIAANFEGAFLDDSNATNADFSVARLFGTSFLNVDLTGANLGGSDMTGATLTGALTASTVNCPFALPNEDFRCVNLDTPGQTAILGPGVILDSVNVSGLTLIASNLNDADLSSADFSNTNLSNSLLQGAILDGINLSGSNLTNANLNGATGTPANTSNITFFNTICPNGNNSNNSGDTCVGQGL